MDLKRNLPASRLLLLCLPAAALAQGTRSYQLKNGDVIRAELIEVRIPEDQVRYRFFAGGGSARPLGRASRPPIAGPKIRP